MESTVDLKFSRSLKIIYSLTLGGVVSGYLHFYLSYCLDNFGFTGDNVFSIFLHYLPFLFFISALPLAIFTLVFLTKGGGFGYFKSWNKGKTLKLSALSVIIGYVLVIFTPNSIGTIASSSSHYDFYVTYFGLSLIALGFGCILFLYRKVKSLNKDSVQKINLKSKKTFFLVIGVLLFLVIIGGHHLKLQRENEFLYRDYQNIKEGIPIPINHEWSQVENENGTYINYKGAIFNSGLEIKKNVVLLVNVRDADGNYLKKAEIPVGDIYGWDYLEFDVNVEYDGEMSDASTTFSWDSPFFNID